MCACKERQFKRIKSEGEMRGQMAGGLRVGPAPVKRGPVAVDSEDPGGGGEEGWTRLAV